MRRLLIRAAFLWCCVALLPVGSASAVSAKDAQVIRGVHRIQIAIQSWCVDHNDKFPPAFLVNAAGLHAYWDRWPRNPWTHKRMHRGTCRGDYTYKRLNGGKRYKLIGHLSSGKTFVVP